MTDVHGFVEPVWYQLSDLDTDLLAERYAPPDAENSIDILRRHLP